MPSAFCFVPQLFSYYNIFIEYRSSPADCSGGTNAFCKCLIIWNKVYTNRRRQLVPLLTVPTLYFVFTSLKTLYKAPVRSFFFFSCTEYSAAVARESLETSSSLWFLQSELNTIIISTTNKARFVLSVQHDEADYCLRPHLDNCF